MHVKYVFFSVALLTASQKYECNINVSGEDSFGNNPFPLFTSVLIKYPKGWVFEATLSSEASVGDELQHITLHCICTKSITVTFHCLKPAFSHSLNFIYLFFGALEESAPV